MQHTRIYPEQVNGANEGRVFYNRGPDGGLEIGVSVGFDETEDRVRIPAMPISDSG